MARSANDRSFPCMEAGAEESWHSIIMEEPTWYDLCVDLPMELGSLVRFRVSLGHKANHSNRFNAQYTLFSVHPAFGTIMAVVAPRQGGDLSLVQIHRDTVL